MSTSPASTIDPIGNYCGRSGPGWWGEPLNSLSNVGFVIAAVIALVAWRRRGGRDPAALVLVAGAFAIGAGSFVLHSHPTHRTLPIDLIPIQIFGLVYVAFAMRRFFAAGAATTLAAVAAFGLATIGWKRSIGHGVLGGAAGHLPSLVAIAIAGAVLAARGRDPGARTTGRTLLAAAAAYTVALIVRAIDLPICAAFPTGVHWVWHLVQGVTVGLLLRAAIAHAPTRGGG